MRTPLSWELQTFFLSKKGPRRSKSWGVVKTLRRSKTTIFAIVVVFLVRKGPLGSCSEAPETTPESLSVRFPTQLLGARLRGRTATQRSKNRSRAKGDALKVTEANLRFPAVLCENLRFSAKICGFLRFPAPSKCLNFQEKG